jgi:NAD(P)H-hydrate epimerase
MHIPEVIISREDHLPIEKFRQMDYLAVEEYHLPIELMMENAGLQLARLVTNILPSPGKVLMGIGIGNNGGGGLVAARRLSAWGYEVDLDMPLIELNPLPKIQLARAQAFGVRVQATHPPDLFVDAYFGFSQRLPLPASFQFAIDRANKLKCPKISLDIPSGFDTETGETLFKPDYILTLAAMKSELFQLRGKVEFYIADLGIPALVYERFNIRQARAFKENGLLSCKFD